jgi:hypothetical protein
MMAGDGIQFYDFNLSAGGSYDLPATGAFYRVITSTGAVSIREDGGGRVGPISAGQGMRNRNFNRLSIRDESGAANKGTLIVAGSDFVDDRITGEVSTIDGGKARSIASGAFSGAILVPAVAAQRAFVQLWNTSTNKNIIVNSVTLASASSCGAGLRISGSPMNPYDVGMVPVNKKAFGSNSLAAECRGKNAAALPMAASAELIHFALQALATQSYRPTEPIVLTPNSGLVIDVFSTNADIAASFEFFEEVI